MNHAHAAAGENIKSAAAGKSEREGDREGTVSNGIGEKQGGDFSIPGFMFSGISAGIKEGEQRDLALFYSVIPATVAGVFTTNRVKAAPVLLDRVRMRKGRCQAIVANSGNANACTGEKGMRDARAMADSTAKALRIPRQLVLVSSTGVIGRPLPIDKILSRIPRLIGNLSSHTLLDAAEAIMTTDTFPKVKMERCSIGQREIRICGVAKGAGMIMPRMATMLCFVMTDAAIEGASLQKALTDVQELTFNRITVDGDTSTNDTVLVLANGMAKNRVISLKSADYSLFRDRFTAVLHELAKMIIRDGEGATKFIEVRVEGARSEADAKKVALSVANSNLVKTAFFGGDANWGRIAAAIGRSGVAINPNTFDILLNHVPVALGGMGTNGALQKEADQVLKGNTVTLTIRLHQGNAHTSIFTCDLSTDYVKINAHYRS
ncbi:MAG: bifunctional glutamate N-acetyltransferase/amino-acid acetyltransferase ArgJ [Syntrophobacterales bacterium]|nr:MAG: bifunctional glutamate N-acetyltransferase/amino-acid acetyltransferase ArgJ [Syntrophobacterales bacterium]